MNLEENSDLFRQKYFDGLEEQVKLYRTIKEQEQEITKLSDLARDQQTRIAGLHQVIRALLANSPTFGHQAIEQLSEIELYAIINEILVNNHYPAISLNRRPERRESINSDKVESSGSPIDISQLVTDNYPEPAKEICSRCHSTNSSRWVKSETEVLCKVKGTYLCNACYRRRNTKKKNEALMRERAGSC
ncbi:hypothetical protein HDV04_001101 [Boothiomyces sp. JEL0838]|nr:hypothetical protein HDV04_001101 [Boothiomyces sp. JEL0838]